MTPAETAAGALRPSPDVVARRVAGEYLLVPVRSGAAQMDYVNLCMLLTLIVDRFEGILALDFKSQTLVDESASPDQRIIAGPPRTTKFFNWAAGHRSNIESLRVIQSLVDPSRRFRDR